jgi:hypothetical protein
MPPRRSVSHAIGTALAIAVALAACAPSAGTPPAPPARAPDALDEGAAPEDGGADEEGDDASEGEEDAGGEPLAIAAASSPPDGAPCPLGMVLVESADLRFCVDRYEASLVEVAPDGTERPYPHWLPVDGHVVRAVSAPDVFPQGFISEVQAEDACAASGKRLCSYGEWKTACMGPTKTTFPYGDGRWPGVCHDTGKSAVLAVFGARALTDPGLAAHPAKPPSGAAKPASAKPAKHAGKTAKHRPAHTTTKRRAAETTRARAARPGAKPPSGNKPPPREKASTRKRATAKASARPASVEPSVWTQLNDPRLGQIDGALAKTGSHEACVNGWGAIDMVGNLHEWVRTDPALPHGTFAGGYYLDTSLNGDGCHYRTTAHAHDYHDYSTGFRCCAEAR